MMDAADAALAGRKKRRARLLPAVALSIAVHLAVGAAAFFAPRSGDAGDAPRRYVSVRIIPGASGGPAPSPKPVKPSPSPEPSPSPPPSPAPPSATPEPIASPAAPSASPDPRALALPSPKTTPSPAAQTPAPSPPPRFGNTGTGPGGPSLEVEGPGGGAAAVAGVDDPDFQYGYYIERMLNQIAANWLRPTTEGEASAVIAFRVRRTGHIVDIDIETGSGISSFDRAAYRAVVGASPLPPLPFDFAPESLGVHLKFK